MVKLVDKVEQPKKAPPKVECCAKIAEHPEMIHRNYYKWDIRYFIGWEDYEIAYDVKFCPYCGASLPELK